MYLLSFYISLYIQITEQTLVSILLRKVFVILCSFTIKHLTSAWHFYFKFYLHIGWDVLREQHWNKYTIKGETDHQPRLDARDKCLGLVHWEDPKDGMGREAGGGIRMGNTCKSMADSCQCMAKTTTIL